MNDLERSGSAVTFETGIRPLFRSSDRSAMMKAFDLWSHADVMAHQDAIAQRLRDGTMPCDGPWPVEQVTAFERWISQGSRP